MNCKDCNTELGDKFVPYDTHVGQFHLVGGVCIDCADKYNSYKHHDGKNRDFCEKCGEKFLSEDLIEVTIKKQKMLVCPRCRD